MDWDLARDEDLLWSGRPAQGILFRTNDIYWIPIGLLFTSFAVFWLSGVLSIAVRPPFGIWAAFITAGTAFLAFFLYILAGRFVVDAWVRARTHYAVTNQRVLIVTKRRTGPKVTALRLERLPELEWTEHGDGTGSIILLRPPEPPWNFMPIDPGAIYAGFHLPVLTKYSPLQFEHIEVVSEVYRRILRSQFEARERVADSEPRLWNRNVAEPTRVRRRHEKAVTSTSGWKLRADEELLWSGRPRQGLVLRRSDAYWIPVGIVSFAISLLFWIGPVVLGGAPTPIAILGFAFVLYCFQVLLGRFFFDAWQRANTVYSLTDRRAIITRTNRQRFRVRELSLSQISLHEVSWRERKDGSGMIWFGRNLPFAMGVAEGIPAPAAYRAPKFDLIGDVEAVYLMFLEAHANLRQH